MAGSNRNSGHNKGKPKPGTKEWQAELNKEIADHDEQEKASGDKNRAWESFPLRKNGGE